MIRLSGLIVLLLNLDGCAVLSVADAAVSVTADVISTGVHVVTGTVDTVVDIVKPSKK
jgi:hypothetical protein